MGARKKDGTLDKDVNELVQETWSEFLGHENFTVTRDRNGIEMQRLAVRILARDGVPLFRKHRAFNNPFGFALEAIEIDRLDHNYNRRAVGTNNEIRFGKEFDDFRAPIAYHILTRHPGDTFAYSSSPRYRERIESSDIIELSVLERAEQSLGIPLWPSVARRLINLHRYEEAEQIAATVAAAKGGFFEKEAKAGDQYIGDDEDAMGNKLVDLAPGQFEELPEGWKAKIHDPTHPTDAFPYFLKGQLRGASAGAALPYNSVASDLENVSYSAYKAGMNDARDVFKWFQRLLALKLMRPIYRAWLPYAILSKKLDIDMAELPRLLNADSWKPRRWAGLEPLKEVQAAVIAVESGLDSKRNIIEEFYDRDIESVYEEQAQDNLLAEQYGLNFEAIEKPIVGAGGGATVDSDTGRSNGNGHRKGGLKYWLSKFNRMEAQETNGNGHHKEEPKESPPITLNVDNRTASKRKVKFNRNDRGLVTEAEIEEL
jgi:lambda family phage portal protein